MVSPFPVFWPFPSSVLIQDSPGCCYISATTGVSIRRLQSSQLSLDITPELATFLSTSLGSVASFDSFLLAFPLSLVFLPFLVSVFSLRVIQSVSRLPLQAGEVWHRPLPSQGPSTRHLNPSAALMVRRPLFISCSGSTTHRMRLFLTFRAKPTRMRRESRVGAADSPAFAHSLPRSCH